MKDLIIFTTKPEFLNQEQDNILFNAQSCSILQLEVEAQNLLKAYDDFRPKPRDIFRIDGRTSIICGTSCLYSNSIEGALPPTALKGGFIPNVIHAVLSSLQAEERYAINRVFIIAHGFDLSLSEKDGVLTIVEHQQVLDSIRIYGKEIVSGEIRKDYHDTTEVGVFVLGFSHTPGQHTLYDILADVTMFQGLDIGEVIMRQVEGVYGVLPESKWMKEWTSEQLDISRWGLSFKQWYINEDVDLVDVTDKSTGWYKPVISQFDNTTTAKKVNVVYISLSQIAAYKNELVKIMTVIGGGLGMGDPDSPVLLVGYKNIMLGGRDAQSGKDVPGEELALRAGVRLDRRFRFMDSSIWFRYAALEDWQNTLGAALDTFAWAYEHKLYQKNVCKEYAELNLRLLEQSKLKSFGDGHALNVYPFVFHSESRMERSARENYQYFKEKGLTWNFLLIDDFAELELKEGGKDIACNTEHTKGEIIKTLINRGPALQQGNEQPATIVQKFWNSKTVNEAISSYFDAENPKEKERLPDIILLDYLFSNPEKLMDEKQHYGTELLEAIIEKRAGRGQSIGRKYWIHPISVFNEAMLSEMLERSYQHFEKDWYLARGADPINTPSLFRCSLFEFLYVQADLLLFDQEELWQFLIDHNFKDYKQISRNNGDQTEKNQRIFNAFRNFLEQFLADEGVETQSAIGVSAKKYMYSEGLNTVHLRDHISNLIFRLAYSRGYDFHAIEREFRLVKPIYIQYEKDHASKPKKIDIAALKAAIDGLADLVYDLHGKD